VFHLFLTPLAMAKLRLDADYIQNLRNAACVARRTICSLAPARAGISALIHVLAHQRKRASPEREDKQRCTPIEKLDLELPIRDRRRLANQLIHPRFVERTMAFCVDINAVGCAGRLTIDRHTKSNCVAARGSAHDEMNVPGVKTIRDFPASLIQHREVVPHRPLTRKRPLVQSQTLGAA
jgi:hypothetical protein